MRAIILAAGRGSRMKSLTDERPKCLVELHGKQLLDWQLEALNAAGIIDVAIVTGYRRELLSSRAAFEFYNPRWEETNMVTSLSYADKWLSSSPCIVSYSDIFYEPSAVETLISSNANLAVTYDPYWLDLWEKRFENPLSDAETFKLKSDKQTLAEIGEKPQSIEHVQGQYMGLLRMTPKGWAEITRIRSSLSEKERDLMHMTGTLQQVICAGNLDITAIPYTNSWGEIDSESDLEIYK